LKPPPHCSQAFSIRKYLAGQGWRIVSPAETRTKVRGFDIDASRANQTIKVGVKGYATKSYRDPKRAGEHKPTDPALQSEHWYSHATLKVMRLKTRYPSAVVVAAFPDFRKYRQLFRETEPALTRIGVAIFFV
jgi:hypothetical protein